MTKKDKKNCPCGGKGKCTCKHEDAKHDMTHCPHHKKMMKDHMENCPDCKAKDKKAAKKCPKCQAKKHHKKQQQ